MITIDDFKKNKLRNRDKLNKFERTMEYDGKKKKTNESWHNFKE